MPTKKPTAFESLWPQVLAGAWPIITTMAEYRAAVAEAERLEAIEDSGIQPGASSELQQLYRNSDIQITDR